MLARAVVDQKSIFYPLSSLFFLILSQEIISSCFFSHFPASLLLVVLFLSLAWRPDCPRFWVRNGLKSAICPVKTACRIHFPLVLMQLDQLGESDRVARRAWLMKLNFKKETRKYDCTKGEVESRQNVFTLLPLASVSHYCTSSTSTSRRRLTVSKQLYEQ